MWVRFKAHFWAVLGNSKTILLAWAVFILGVLDELQFVDWMQLFGVERGGRIAAIMSLVMIGMRLVTTAPVQFKVNPDPPEKTP